MQRISKQAASLVLAVSSVYLVWPNGVTGAFGNDPAVLPPTPAGAPATDPQPSGNGVNVGGDWSPSALRGDPAAAPASAATTDPATTDPSATTAATGPTTADAAATHGTTTATAPTTAADAEPVPMARRLTAGQVSVSETGVVEMHANDASIVELLKTLAVQSQRNIIVSREVKGTVTVNLYDVTVREALDAIVNANGFAYREKGNFIYVYGAKELSAIEQSERKTVNEVFRVFYTTSQVAANMIKPVLSKDGQVSLTPPATVGLESSSKEAGGNSHSTEDVLVVSDYPENIELVRKVLKEIDRRPQQILLEATILHASLTDDNALGIDFTVLGGVDFTQISPLGANSGAGVLNGNVLNNPNAYPTYGQGFQGATTGFTNNVPNGGLRVGLVNNNVAVFIQALESLTNTTVLANPKILALNKQKGEVIVGRKDGYLTTTVTQSSSVQTVEFLDTGTRLIFRPYIGDDGYIRMEIHPEDSSGGLTSNANLPYKITTEVTSNVMIKDGRTIVIGGLFRESSDTARSQIPLLGNIPLAGALFRNQRDRTSREEIIILLTPHIVKDEEGYAAESESAKRDFEKLRVGVRNGMMPIGRERLAEADYERAVNEMAKPNPNKDSALFHLNCAINANPTFLEAIKLKQELTGKELSNTDNSSIHGFVQRRILGTRGMSATTTPSMVPLDPAKSDASASAVIDRNTPLPGARPRVFTTGSQKVTVVDPPIPAGREIAPGVIELPTETAPGVAASISPTAAPSVTPAVTAAPTSPVPVAPAVPAPVAPSPAPAPVTPEVPVAVVPTVVVPLPDPVTTPAATQPSASTSDPK